MSLLQQEEAMGTESHDGSVKAESFGLEGKAQLFTLQKGAMQLRATNWGATIVSLIVPDKAGQYADVVLGFDTLTPYMDGSSPYFGSVVGRVANRISGASFTLDGQEHKLVATTSNPDITLHGGKKGFDKVLWEVKEMGCNPDPFVQFVYHSFDGEEGFPGDVDVSVTYRLSGDFELRTEMEAIPNNKSTPINLAQHSYWNLAGHQSGDILGHYVRLWASHITPVNEQLIPTGEFLSVDGTPFDFKDARRIGDHIIDVPGGYDHNYVLGNDANDEGDLHLAARIKDLETGRVMDVLTNAPGMQFYTGNFVPDIEGKDGSKYRKHSGLCLETQGLPNAVNQPKFPSIIYNPGQLYRHIMVHRFYTEHE